MDGKINKTILVSAPKRSGGTLLTRLFDNQPGVIDFIDEAFFWEHAYRYHSQGQEKLFVDMFKTFSPKEIVASLFDRQMLPWVDGIYRQIAPKKIEIDMGMDKELFLKVIELNQRDLSTIEDVWFMLTTAYAKSMKYNLETHNTVFMFGGDYGRAMFTAGKTLKNSKNIFIMRNPFYALESLKKSRLERGQKVLHPINFIESMSFYSFFWDNKESIIDKNTILIRYEDLLRDTEATMKKVAAHVEIPFTKNLTTPSLRGDTSWGGDSAFGPLNGVDKTVLDRKIKMLNETEIGLIREHLWPILEYFDYKV